MSSRNRCLILCSLSFGARRIAFVLRVEYSQTGSPRQICRRNCKILYRDLLTSGKLQSYLADIEEEVQSFFISLLLFPVGAVFLSGVTEKIG